MFEVAENGNSQVKKKYLKIVLKHSNYVNVLSYFALLSFTLLYYHKT